jgi:hypothetical protein
MECYQQPEEESLRSVVEYQKPKRVSAAESAATGKSDAALQVILLGSNQRPLA